MDGRHLDALAKRLSSRRTALGSVFAALLLPLEAADGKGKGRNRKRKDKRKGRGKGKDSGYGNRRTRAQAEPCWRVGACSPKKGANVSRCDLQGYFPSVTLDCTGCNISRANLRGANLSGANLTKANLSGACLVDADFTGATFASNTNLSNAIFCNTIMPDGSVNDSGCARATECCPICNEAICDQTCCNLQCVNMQTSSEHCGTCGNACGSGQRCCGGQCRIVQSDPNNCGACGTACGQGQGCCGGQCLNVQTDPTNCGTCGKTCPSGQICCNGVCCDGCCGADGSCGACLVFLSSSTSNGNLGGLDGADKICQDLARAVTPAPLPGVYKAWLSTHARPNESPYSGRMRRSGQPYKLVNGTQIAANWDDLTDRNLAAPINVTESGQTVTNFTSAWTNTHPDGWAIQTASYWTCNAWRSGSDSDAAIVGGVTFANEQWSILYQPNCSNAMHLYCFQQQ